MISLLSFLPSPCPVHPPFLPPHPSFVLGVIPPSLSSLPLPLLLLLLPQSAAGERTVDLTGRDTEPHSQTHVGLWKQHTPTNLKHTVVYPSPLSRGSGRSLECVCGWVYKLGGCVCVSVCFLCVDECVGVLHHFWWDFERCVCHSVGGWAIGGRAPPPSPPSSSSSSLCPSSPPRLRSLREPSTSPKTVSTPPL